jgi:hypothetical protein
MKTQIIKFASFFGVLFMFITACSQEDESTYRLNTKLVELNCNGTLALEVSPALQGLSYTSLNTNIATVSPGGLVTAKLVGSTKIVVKDSLNLFVDTVKVVVNSTSTAFNNPYLEFGADQSTIIEVMDMTDYSLTDKPPYTMLFFPVSLNVIEYAYYLNDEGKLVYSLIAFNRNEYEDFSLEKHLTDRYSVMKTFEHYKASDTYYINPDSSLIVLFQKPPYGIYETIEFHQANQERVQHILSEEDSYTLASWLRKESYQ